MQHASKKSWIFLTTFSCFFAFSIQATQNTTMHTFKNDEEKASYIIGHEISASIKNGEFKINESILIDAIKSGLSGKKSEIPPQESQAFMQKYMTEQQKTRGDRNLKEGEAFLAKNKKEKGVVTLPSGLQYKIITEGKGAKPKTTDTVTVHYEGKLINGTVFDSSYQRGQAVSFPVTGVIKGWTEALQLMSEGSTWMLYIPTKLAYAAQAPSSLIGPNSTLIFKVNLESIAKEPSTQKPVENKK